MTARAIDAYSDAAAALAACGSDVAAQIPACQVLGKPVRSNTSSIRRHASRASGCARRLRAIEFRKLSMICTFG
jgi:hypothetical protein